MVTRLLAGEVVTHHGAHIQVDDAYLLTPRPVQEKIPLLIGGNGERVVRLGGRVADIVSLTGTGRTLADGHRHEVDWSDAGISARVEMVRGAALRRRSQSQSESRPALDALVQHLAITRDRAAAAEQVAPARSRSERAANVSGSPYVLLGTLDEMAAEIAQHYERWGFTSYVRAASGVRRAAARAGIDLHALTARSRFGCAFAVTEVGAAERPVVRALFHMSLTKFVAVTAVAACAGGGVVLGGGVSGSSPSTLVVLDHYLCSGRSRSSDCDPVNGRALRARTRST